MSKGRLTRQELGWLLTQEAQGAAGRLRQGVTLLKSNPPPDAPADVGIDATLDALDDTMRMLSSLHARPSHARGRRGRVDIAALLWEVAPDARVSLEPGSGTEVFGDEAELRRMVGLLSGHGAGAESEVHVKREGDFVKIAVVLGPDSSATEESERAWLSRMAIRYGGRYELEGGMEAVTLPADGVSERKEREQLEKELDEARKQGEAYARELAAAFSSEGEAVSPSTFPPPTTGPDVAERFSALARFAGGIAAELRAMLSPVTRDLAAIDGGDERIEGVRRALGHAQDFVSSLASIGELDVSEPAAPLDLAELVRAQVERALPRASRAEVKIACDVQADGPDPRVLARTSFRACQVLVHQLLVQAIAASPRGTEIRVHLRDEPEARGPRLVIDDAGPQLPSGARRGFVGLEVEPGTYGRPTAIPLHVAAELAAWQGAELEIGDAPSGGLRVTLLFLR